MRVLRDNIKASRGRVFKSPEELEAHDLYLSAKEHAYCDVFERDRFNQRFDGLWDPVSGEIVLEPQVSGGSFIRYSDGLFTCSAGIFVPQQGVVIPGLQVGKRLRNIPDLVIVSADSGWGCIDLSSMTELIPPRYELLSSYDEPIAWLRDRISKQEGLFDLQHRSWLVEPEYAAIRKVPGFDNIYGISDRSRRRTVLNARTRRWVTPFRYYVCTDPYRFCQPNLPGLWLFKHDIMHCDLYIPELDILYEDCIGLSPIQDDIYFVSRELT